MDHDFSWRKVVEAVLAVTVLYNFLAIVGGGGPDIPGTITVVLPFALLYTLTSKGLEKLSGSSKDSSSHGQRAY